MLNQLEQFFDSVWDKLHSSGGRKDSHISSADPALLWDAWELDPKFFQALSQWTLDHPETTLDRVVANICDGIDKGKDLLELIPDNPFPARSLVKALGCLMKLGVTVSRAKTAIQEFAQDIIHWVSEMRSAFESFGGGRFTYRAKKNLKKIRDLIDEICKWATARLTDGRWLRITHGLSIAEEINEFKARIASARALFTNISMINISQGVDDIIREIHKVRQLQRVQLRDIQENLHAQKQAEERRQFLSRMLLGHTVANATYHGQGKQPCDADTRVEILADIKTWVYDMSDGSQSFMWLTGDPGSGKSAITASVARECNDAGILWAQFFVNRNNADTTDPRSYFPSIARQLAEHIPDSAVALAVHDALRDKPSLIEDISINQASKLFLDAVEVASKLDRRKPVVVVIDGLDETDRPRLRLTADIFSKLFAKLRCRNVKVFISSRTEDDIQKPFSKAFDERHVKHVHLDTSADSSIQDVSNFMRRRIAEIVENNDLNWEVWPGEERMQALCTRASGLFIWGATVVKFFQEQIDATGRECLNDLLDALSTEGMGDINVLYGAILHLMYKDRKDSWAFETFRRIVGYIVVLREPLSLAEIENLLDLRQTVSSGRVDIQHFVRRLRTILVSGTDPIDGQTIPRLHKSFFEFITSERADKRFRVDASISNGELAMRCLIQLASVSEEHTTAYGIHPSPIAVDSLPSGFGYALQFWSSHLLEEGVAKSGLATIGSVPELLFDLLDSSNDLDHSRFLNINFSPNRAQIVTSWDNLIRSWDRLNGQPVDGLHTGEVNCIAFSPDGTRVVSGSSDSTLRLWDSKSGQPIGSPLLGHTDLVLSVAFSLDGKRVVSGSQDNTIRVWDSANRKQISSLFQTHSSSMFSVAFSPDGKQIVSSTGDRYICVWDVESGQPNELPFQGHTGLVLPVAYSSDGNRIVSGSRDHTLRLWDSKSGQPIGSPFQGHTSDIWSVAFSQDGRRVVSGSQDKTIRVWDSQSGQLIGSPFEGHTGTVHSVAFSPDSKRVLSSGHDHTIRTWNSQTGQPLDSPFHCPTGNVWSVAFSSDGKQVACSSNDFTVSVWDPKSGRRYAGWVRAFALSPDGTYMVSVSSDDAIRLWDVQTNSPLEMSLEGNAKGLISIAISTDGSRIAMASLNGTIYLWDAATGLLASPPIESCIRGFTSLSFSPDGSRVILASIGGKTCVRSATDGKPINTVTSPSSYLLESTIKYFNTHRGWGCSGLDKREAVLEWCPSNDPTVGLWACINGKIIRSNRGASVTIIDLNDFVNKRGVSV